MLVSKPTHGGGAPLGIDLEAGVATIRLPAKPVAQPDAERNPDPDAEPGSRAPVDAADQDDATPGEPAPTR